MLMKKIKLLLDFLFILVQCSLFSFNSTIKIVNSNINLFKVLICLYITVKFIISSLNSKLLKNILLFFNIIFLILKLNLLMLDLIKSFWSINLNLLKLNLIKSFNGSNNFRRNI